MNPFLVNGVGSPQSVWQTSTTKHHKIGTKGSLRDGRVFYYTSLAAAGTTLVRGQLLVTPIVVANHYEVAQTTAYLTQTVGATRITVGIGGTALTANQYVEGWVNVNKVTGLGYDYKVRNHGVSAAGTEDVSFELYDPIVVATATTSEITLVANPYSNPAVSAAIGLIVGVPKVGVVADASVPTYYWAQTWGECAVLSDTAATIGTNAIWHTTNGAFTISSGGAEQNIGTAFVLTVTGEYQMIYLTIRP